MNKKISNRERKLDLLLAIYITSIVAAELMGSKTFSIFFLNSSVAIFTLPITFIINDVVTEVEGKARSLSFMHATFMILILLALFNLLAISLPPTSISLTFEPAYQTIFAKSLRMTLASLAAFFLSERLDIYIFTKIRSRLKNSSLWLRSNVSNILSLFFDTSIFMFLAFFNGNNSGFVWSLILPYYGLKCLFSIFETPLTYVAINWLKRSK
ncbi:MAG TPA: queuosine precursor transporter [Candidatus Woesebacteria bacterium]|nr:queuosine precursor transporter [Candidatus Woesebacteria bacterium]